AQQYVLLPLWSTGSQDPQNIDDNAAFDVKENENKVHVSPSGSDKTKKHDEKAKRKDKGKSHVGSPTGVRDLRDEFEEFSFNSTNRKIFICISFKYPDDPDMPELEDIVYSDEEEDVGAEADFFNSKTNISVSLIPTTKVHKDHPFTQIIGDLTSAPQTRSMAKMGHTQEEGIDYDEVFAPVARIEALRLFLAYASFMGFMVYKVVKALYGLHQAPRAWYETLANYLLENGFQKGKIDQTLFIKKQKASTLIKTEKPLLKDPDGEDVDVHIYRSMIGSLMYLTSSRLDIMFAVCACARFQVTPKVSHLHTVKRIFRYLKGKPHLGLWYPKDSPFNLMEYSDSDYVGASLDRKSITGGCRLISWQCKKQTVVATSSTEAEYVAAASCCAQVLWIQNQLLDYGYKLMLFGLTKDVAVKLMLLDTHNMVAYLSKSDASAGIDQIVDFLNAQVIQYALMVNPTIYVSCIKQFWATASIKKANDVVKLQALIDRKKVVVTEDVIRHDLLNDQDDAKMFDVNDLHGEEVFVEKEVTDKEVNDEVQKVVEEVVEDTNTTMIIIDAVQVGAAEELVKLKKKDQIRLDEEAALRLQDELQA
nr:uncharacterized mitochondrial protein AtMg00810-like [Tanacetum cinerariifolium]